MSKGSGGWGRSGRSGGGGSPEQELDAAKAELAALTKQIEELSPPQLSRQVMKNPVLFAEYEAKSREYVAKRDPLWAKRETVRAKIETLKSSAQKATEAAAVKAMQDRGYNEARDKVMGTGAYKPIPKRQKTAEEKRIQRMLDHIDD